ncbi:hypothetical protein DPMN_182739 [Dreissena polymorpha]|uniref:Uncharacterized protein n=1 Tax=Dreissena polymorpha TaxID=45954 RepID=A0A9D4I2X8_DREPO|nr:hypothetical protein DPMN_182739 [Dreissena polymorpha]
MSIKTDYKCDFLKVLTRFYYSHIKENAPPSSGTILQLILDIIKTNFPTKFHEDCTINEKNFREDRTINVSTRVLTRQILTLQMAQQERRSNNLKKAKNVSTLN